MVPNGWHAVSTSHWYGQRGGGSSPLSGAARPTPRAMKPSPPASTDRSPPSRACATGKATDRRTSPPTRNAWSKPLKPPVTVPPVVAVL